MKRAVHMIMYTCIVFLVAVLVTVVDMLRAQKTGLQVYKKAFCITFPSYFIFLFLVNKKKNLKGSVGLTPLLLLVVQPLKKKCLILLKISII